MWTKRSEADIREFLARQERKRKSLIRPLVYGLIWGSLFTTIYGLGYRGGLAFGVWRFDPHSRFDGRLLVPGIIATVVVVAIVYYRQLNGLRFFDTDDSVLCTGCFEPKSPNSTKTCECGGRLEPYDFYEWNEPEIPDNPPAEAQG